MLVILEHDHEEKMIIRDRGVKIIYGVNNLGLAFGALRFSDIKKEP